MTGHAREKLTVAVAMVILCSAVVVLAGEKKSLVDEKVDEGKKLYLSQKFRCFQCHGPSGAEGGMGPSFKGIGTRYDRDGLLEKAAHACSPSGACNPKELGTIVDYLRTL